MSTTKEFQGGLTLGRKKSIKKSTVKPAEIERVVKEIHKEEKKEAPKAKTTKREQVKEDIETGAVQTKKAGVVLPIDLFKRMKKRAVEQDMTISEYFTGLLLSDLEKA